MDCSAVCMGDDGAGPCRIDLHGNAQEETSALGLMLAVGVVNPFSFRATNGRYLRIPAGWSGRKPDIAKVSLNSAARRKRA